MNPRGPGARTKDQGDQRPYLRVKGAAEQIVERSGIARTSLFRPSLLVTRAIRYGLQDRLTQRLFPLVAPLLANGYHQIRVEDLARAMRVNAERPGPPAPYVVSGFPSEDLRAGSRTVSPGVEGLEYPISCDC